MNDTQNKKRILFIAPQPFFEVRGTPIAIKDMLTILSKEYLIDFVSFPQGENRPIENVVHYRCASFGIKKVKIGPSVAKLLLDFALFIKAVSLVRKNRYDYIHCVEEAALFGVFLKKRTNAKLVYDMDSIMSEQIAGGKFKFAKFLFEAVERVIIRNSNLILAVSINFKDYCKSINPHCNFVEIFDVPQIEKAELPEELKRKFNANSRKKVLYVGNGEKYQGVDLLEKVAKEMPEIDFYIVGTGKEGAEQNRIYISQVKMEHVWGIMQLANVLVSPRLSGTNTPMKIYTYMASGKPIVATGIDAHKILKDTGYVVSVDPTAMTEGIKTALHDGLRNPSKTLHLLEKCNFFVLRQIVVAQYSVV